MEYRGAFIFARTDPDASLPKLKNMEDWLSVKSTKLDSFARICVHYLRSDDVEPITFENGELIFPPVVQKSAKAVSRTRRICAYIEFVSFKPIVEQVSLSLYLISHGLLN